MTSVQFFFDFISPYSYLASELLRRKDDLDRRLEYRPVVFGSMLSHRGVKGPGEDPLQRRIGLQDNLLRAAVLGIEFNAPPAHPFNPLMALRSVCAVGDLDLRRRLTHRYFELGWKESRPLDDPAVLREALAELGIDQDPDAAASDREARKLLKQNTAFALEKGATGVPTFLVDDVLFFGGDRIELLEAYLGGAVELDREKLEALMARQGVERVI